MLHFVYGLLTLLHFLKQVLKLSVVMVWTLDVELLNYSSFMINLDLGLKDLVSDEKCFVITLPQKKRECAVL